VIFLFSATLFTSSALLFIVEPMIAKMILPLLGGTPAVWNTCMVFYQLALLGGYLYAHVLSQRFTRSQQIAIHISILASSILTLPILLTSAGAPPVSTSPIPWLLGTLARTAGIPLFVVSSTSPLLQRWFASDSRRNPYPLYAAGNAGSLLALALYPALVEPALTLKRQSVAWAIAYTIFMGLTIACAAYTRRARATAADPEGDREATPAPSPSPAMRTKWIALAAVPSSLMLGVTTFLTTDIAAVPLLWILPLGLYLATFVLVFAERQVVSHQRMARLLSLLVIPTITLVTLDRGLPPAAQIAFHLATFFVASMVCHGELARHKPPTEHLTLFYLCLAAGGVLGGIFNAIVAPLVFNSIVEYPLMIILACALGRMSIGDGQRTRWSDLAAPLALGAGTLAMMLLFEGGTSNPMLGLPLVFFVPGVVLFTFRQRPVRFALGVAAMIVAGTTYMSAHERVIQRGRSFFGAHRITRDPANRYRLFVNGGIVHGAQSTAPAERREPTTYYHRSGPIGQVFAGLAPAERRSVGVVGLGVGTLAAYSRPNEHWTFYEIDPTVVEVARDRRYFTFLDDSPASIDIVLGDARLSLARAEDRRFDLLVLDAFSSDAIPVHLLTREALALYLSKLLPTGVVAFHISNRYVDLKPLLAGLASSFGLVCLAQDDLRLAPTDKAPLASRWLLMAHRRADFGPLSADSRWETVDPRSQQVVWSDEFSNLLSVFRWRG
jgi:spermidine synthase